MLKRHMVQDIAEKSFWDKIPFLQPFAQLARWDRPIGFWLLFWPCVWGAALAPHFQERNFQYKVWPIFLFFIGAIAMRGAGCTLNDLIDRKLDRQVERTRNRPLASGRVKPWMAVIFLLLQLAVGAWVLLQLPQMAIYIGLCTLPLIVAYPFMKRIVWWPQVFLGLIFASGALIGWASIETALHWPALVLYAAGIGWVVCYDTVYAHMDADDDALFGIKSTALWWGPYSKLYVGWGWAITGMLFAVALALVESPILSYVMLGVAMVALYTSHNLWNPENPKYSLWFFRLQNQIGFLLALACLAPVLFS